MNPSMRFLRPLAAAVFILSLAFLAAPIEAGAKEKRRLIFYNDGGTLGAPNMEAPLGIEGLVRSTLDPLRDTMADTLIWQLGTDPYFGTDTHRLSDWYSHSTKVGARWGSDRTKFKTAGEWRIFRTTQQLEEIGTDPVTVVVTEGRRAGLEVFLGLRINDGHDSFLPNGLADINMAPTRKQHPDWLLGDDAAMLETVTGRLKLHAKTAYNFALPEVRQYTFSLVREAIQNYDLDGFDLDFCRQPSLFKIGEAAQGSPLVIELLAKIRAELDTKGKTVGRRLYLSVRVPPELDETKRIGLDVAQWIKRRLVDIVIVGEPGGWHYRLPIERYRELAKGTDCKIIAQNLCAFKEDRGRSAAVLFNDPLYYTTEQFRAVAARHWRAGADGLSIWNQHFLRFSRDENFDRQAWREIGDPQVIARKNKHYIVGPVGRGGSLPLELADAGAAATINVEIADDFSGKYPPKTVLRIQVEQLTDLDRVDFQLNGSALDRKSAIQRLNYNDCWLDFDVSGLVRQGDNALSLKTIARNPHVIAPLTIRSVEALVTYP